MTQELLKEYFSYDKHSGIFTRIKTDSKSHLKFVGQPTGVIASRGYIQIKFRKKRYYAHRLAWLYETGEWPEEIDHINRVKDDNRFINLESVDRIENHRRYYDYYREKNRATTISP